MAKCFVEIDRIVMSFQREGVLNNISNGNYQLGAAKVHNNYNLAWAEVFHRSQ